MTKPTPSTIEKEIIDLNNVIYEVRDRQFAILDKYEKICKVFDKLKKMEDELRDLDSLPSRTDI